MDRTQTCAWLTNNVSVHNPVESRKYGNNQYVGLHTIVHVNDNVTTRFLHQWVVERTWNIRNFHPYRTKAPVPFSWGRVQYTIIRLIILGNQSSQHSIESLIGLSGLRRPKESQSRRDGEAAHPARPSATIVTTSSSCDAKRRWKFPWWRTIDYNVS